MINLSIIKCVEYFLSTPLHWTRYKDTKIHTKIYTKLAQWIVFMERFNIESKISLTYSNISVRTCFYHKHLVDHEQDFGLRKNLRSDSVKLNCPIVLTNTENEFQWPQKYFSLPSFNNSCFHKTTKVSFCRNIRPGSFPIVTTRNFFNNSGFF